MNKDHFEGKKPAPMTVEAAARRADAPAANAPEPGDLQRAGLYRLLGSLLAAPPGGELLQTLARPAPGETDGAMATAWEALRLAAERARAEDVDDEYHDLFIGVGRGELVPYASWYLTGFLMDQPLVLLRRDLERLGIARAEAVSEPEDHVAALCEAMALVIEDDGPELDEQRQFFRTHLSPWIGTFFDDLQNAQSARFYGSVGHLGVQLVALEERYLEMDV